MFKYNIRFSLVTVICLGASHCQYQKGYKIYNSNCMQVVPWNMCRSSGLSWELQTFCSFNGKKNRCHVSQYLLKYVSMLIYFSRVWILFRQLLWFIQGAQPHASNFHLCPAEGSSEMLGWSSGPLGLWTSESSTSVHWIEKDGAALPALPIRGPSPPQRTLPPAQYHRRAFKCSLKGKKAEREEIRDCVLPGAQ